MKHSIMNMCACTSALLMLVAMCRTYAFQQSTHSNLNEQQQQSTALIPYQQQQSTAAPTNQQISVNNNQKSNAPTNPISNKSAKQKSPTSPIAAIATTKSAKLKAKVQSHKSAAAAAAAGGTSSSSSGGRHHLVNKIKDARSRRRRHRQETRQQKYRRQQHQREKQASMATSGKPLGADGRPMSGDQLAQFQQFKSMIENQQMHSVPEQGSATLTALESIVDEVARAGQQLVSSSVQVVLAPASIAAAAVAAQSSQSTSPSGNLNTNSQLNSNQVSDLQLDGSSSPMVQVKSTTAQMQQQQQQQQQNSAASTATTSSLPQASTAPISTLRMSNNNNQQQPDLASQHPLTPIRGNNPLNSRGFFLTTMLSKIMNVLNVTEFAIEMRDGISSRASCMACNAVVGLFLSPLYSKEVFSAAIRTVCTSFKIQSPRVCSGLAESFQDDLEFIRKNTKLTRDEVCGVVFGIDCARRPTYNLFWTVPIPHYPPKIGAINPQVAQDQQQQGNMDLQQQQQPNLNGRPISEASMINMEDAPDLFEYRRSNGNLQQQASQQQAFGTTLDPSHHQHQQPEKSVSTSSSSGNKNNKNQAKSLLKRPQYIFEDPADQGNLNSASSSSSSHAAPGEPTMGSNSNVNKISSFVQITDIHIDPYYETGSLSDCKEPLCCRATSGHVQPGDKRRQAGKWGDYGNCDLPVRTLRSALSRIREQHPNAEYWIWTGDISPHDIWNISKAESANDVRLVTKMVREYSNGLPVFPVIGNHEAHPVNSFSPPEIKGRFSMSWLYDTLADEWSDWLPKDAQDSLRIGGYYRLQVRKGFRIIALNTNYCARLNPWSFYDPVDPANQLRWLVDELLEAEINGDKVHIIGHVPPDNRECTQAWLFNFINIVDRFKDTIEAQFYGHTHRDEFRIMYSLKVNGPGQAAQAEQPIGMQFIGPSITPFTENNPAYRIYHQNQAGRLVDAQTYFFNLTEANENPEREPRWQFSYNAQSHLNMTNGLRPHDWHQYVQKLYDDDEMFDNFFRNFYRGSEPKVNQMCRYKCKYQILSDLRLLHPYKTKPKPFLANRKTSNHNHHHHHHQTIHQHLQQKRLRYSEREPFMQRV